MPEMRVPFLERRHLGNPSILSVLFRLPELCRSKPETGTKAKPQNCGMNHTPAPSTDAEILASLGVRREDVLALIKPA